MLLQFTPQLKLTLSSLTENPSFSIPFPFTPTGFFFYLLFSSLFLFATLLPVLLLLVSDRGGQGVGGWVGRKGG